MNTAKEIKSLEDKVNSLRSKQDVAKGKLEVAKEALKESGFDSVEEAETWLGEEEIRLEALEKELEEDILEFKNTYENYL